MISSKLRTYSVYLFCLILLASCGVNARIKKADKRYSIGEYQAAGEMYRSAYSKVSRKDKRKKGYVAFRQGECYRLTNNKRAATAYRNAITNRYNDTTLVLRYAQVLQRDGRYGEAAKQYANYLKKYPNNITAQRGLASCEQAAEWKQIFSRYKVTEAKEINEKRSSTFSASYIGSSTDAIVFCSTRSTDRKMLRQNSSITGMPNNDIFSMRKNASGKWEDAEKIAAVSTEYDEGVCSFTSDGKMMYFTRAQAINGSDRGAEICTSSRSGGEWGEPQPIKLFEDSTITVAHPSINATGDTLYFVSDAPGGVGGKDIWMAEMVEGNWTNIQNLGDVINTPEDEMFPYIRNNGELYFASNGHPGFGGLDLQKAIKDESGNWVVVNMGVPFNSEGDDFGICFAYDSESGFFSSNRKDKKGYDKVYSFVLPELVYALEGRVSDNNGEPLSDAYIRIVGNDGTIVKMRSKKDGSYRFKMNPNVKYVLMASCRGYLNQKQEASTVGFTDSKVVTTHFTLSPISKPVTMDNIFYEFGKWTLTPESESGLEELIKLLNDNPNITIEISAHTDRVGNEQFNKELSEKRAQSVVNYLIEHGIEKERLTAVGYGKEQPVVADKTIHTKYPFIPIGQTLDETFIDSLTKEQQEMANQINRRTEFKVLKTTYKLY